MTARTFTFTVAEAPGDGLLLQALGALDSGASALHAFTGWGQGWSRISWPGGGHNGLWNSGLVRGHWDAVTSRLYWFSGSHELTNAVPFAGLQQFIVFDTGANAFSRPYIGSTTTVQDSINHAWDQCAFDTTGRRLLSIVGWNENVRQCQVDGPYPASCEQPARALDVSTDPRSMFGAEWSVLQPSFPYKNSSHYALSWHPNLFGTGDGALVAIVGSSFRSANAWRQSTGLWSTILGPAGETRMYVNTGISEPTAAYSPITLSGAGSAGVVFAGFGDETAEIAGENVRIYYDAALARPVWRQNQSQTPGQLAAQGWTGNTYPVGGTQSNPNHRLHIHPDGTPLIMEGSPSAKANGRVKKLNLTTWQWEDAGYFHPFLDAPRWGTLNSNSEGGLRDWPVVTIPNVGMVGLKMTNATEFDVPKMILWRPQ
jgi:hypothetical protein